MFEVINDLPDEVIGVSAHGKIEAADYENVMNPLVENALENHDKLAALIVLGPDFEGYTAKAAFDDMKLGLGHATSFSRIAIVSDKDFLRNSWDTLMHLFPAKSKGFSMDDMEEARSWVTSGD